MEKQSEPLRRRGCAPLHPPNAAHPRYPVGAIGMTIPRKLAFLSFILIPVLVVLRKLVRDDDNGSLPLTDERMALLVRAEREQNYTLFGVEEP